MKGRKLFTMLFEAVAKAPVSMVPPAASNVREEKAVRASGVTYISGDLEPTGWPSGSRNDA